MEGRPREARRRFDRRFDSRAALRARLSTKRLAVSAVEHGVQSSRRRPPPPLNTEAEMLRSALPARVLPTAAARAASTCSARVPALAPQRARAAELLRADCGLGRGLTTRAPSLRGVAARAQPPKKDEWVKPDPEGRDVWDSELVGGVLKVRRRRRWRRAGCSHPSLALSVRFLRVAHLGGGGGWKPGPARHPDDHRQLSEGGLAPPRPHT